jgi:hypothetical protein
MTFLEPLRAQSLVAITGKRHGLGNRVRVVLGSRSLARLEGRRFFYTWHTGEAFGSQFNDLWDVTDPVISRATARALSVRYPRRDASLTWIDDDTRHERVWQISTPHALMLPPEAVPWEEELQALRPVRAVATLVRTFFDQHLAGEPYIGVMVRAHPNSHAVTLAESPVAWYIDRMRELRLAHPTIRFFVSADTEQAQAAILSAVVGSFAQADKGGYNNPAGLRASVADLYLLASSGHILAPHYSSFPELAQKLAGRQLALETSHSDAQTAARGESNLSFVDDPTNPHIRRVH